jgi:hypothetical protein
VRSPQASFGLFLVASRSAVHPDSILKAHAGAPSTAALVAEWVMLRALTLPGFWKRFPWVQHGTAANTVWPGLDSCSCSAGRHSQLPSNSRHILGGGQGGLAGAAAHAVPADGALRQLGLRVARAAVWSAALVLTAAQIRLACQAAGDSIVAAAVAAGKAATLAVARLALDVCKLAAWRPAPFGRP